MPAAAKTRAKLAAKKPAAKVGAPSPAGNFYLGQIEAFAFDFAPSGWMACNGQTLSIQQNQALFSLLGTTYGGDGVRTFALPKLAPITPAGPNLYIAAAQNMFPYPTRT
ncbi:MAG TPA: tail fiber protein [Xanthobacteraceae bacterium]|nr:tail fiber protein [Xanthobacteraceae bacterium]